jgi:hypothetical protein
MTTCNSACFPWPYRIAFTLLAVGVLLGWLLNLGERGLALWDDRVMLAMATLLVPPMLAWRRWPWRLTIATLAVMAGALTFQAGSTSYVHAYNACLDDGEIARNALHEFRRQHGSYPARLEDLPGPLPCGLYTRPTILVYRAEGNGYTLSFGDSLVTHSATEAEAFSAHK